MITELLKGRDAIQAATEDEAPTMIATKNGIAKEIPRDQAGHAMLHGWEVSYLRRRE